MDNLNDFDDSENDEFINYLINNPLFDYDEYLKNFNKPINEGFEGIFDDSSSPEINTSMNNHPR